MKYGEVRQRVLKKIRPTKQELSTVAQATKILVAELEAALAVKQLSAEVFVGGSSVKGTGLRNNYDVDVFIRYKKDGLLSNNTAEVLALLPDAHERVHGSRDYFQLQRGKILFEIVPVLHITNHKKALNVTDMSPLHVTYAQDKLTSRMKDDVRLAKQFCKALRIYGAESYLNGFSGHVLEQLIMHHGSFKQLLAAASKWQAPTVIDAEQHHKNPLAALNESKTYAPLIIVDPVQPDRNAAAALSQMSYDKFVTAAQRFINKPSLAAFTIKPFTKAAIKQRHKKGSLVFIILQGGDGKRDVIGAKCLKAFDYLRTHLEGFTINNYGFNYDHATKSALAYIHVQETLLPKTYEQPGPPVNAQPGATRFRQKHRGKTLRERDGRLSVVQERKYRTLKQQVYQLSKDKPVTTRARVTL